MIRSRRKALLLLLSAVVFLVTAEIAARAYWRVLHDVPFRQPGRILHAYYVLEPQETEGPEDDTYDILLLGGSTLDRGWGSVEQQLLEQLAEHGRREVRVFNLATAGHTTRDSRLKYEAIGNDRFDLVVVYHGLNDVRLNYVTPERFRDDYSHDPRHEIVNIAASYNARAAVALPYSLAILAATIRHRMSAESRREWTAEGANVKTVGPFTQNLTAILDLASARGERVMLMTYATHVPPNYSADLFDQGRLDYLMHTSPIEGWGRPEHVIAAVARHNDAIRALAGQRGILLVDQDRLMPRSAHYFNDICHLTSAGSARFAEHMIAALPATAPAPLKDR